VESVINIHQRARVFPPKNCAYPIYKRDPRLQRPHISAQETYCFLSVHVSTQLHVRGALLQLLSTVCCSVLQCVAVCCSVLQCVVVCCSVLQCLAVCCSVVAMLLQCCCNVVAECCRVLQSVLQRITVHYSVLRFVAMGCSMLQYVAVCCSVLRVGSGGALSQQVQQHRFRHSHAHCCYRGRQAHPAKLEAKWPIPWYQPSTDNTLLRSLKRCR